MPIKHALIVANGTPPSRERLLAAAAESDYVLAADGGANTLLAAGITPNAVLGDFDSLTVALPESVARIPAPDQNYTDLDKAVGFLVESGATRITIMGAAGGRLDHTLGTLTIMAKYGRSIPILLLDDFATAALVDDQIAISTRPDQIVSLLPLGGVEGVTTKGLKWNLMNEALGPGKRDGTSNVATGESAEISVGSGNLIVYLHHPESS